MLRRHMAQAKQQATGDSAVVHMAHAGGLGPQPTYAAPKLCTRLHGFVNVGAEPAPKPKPAPKPGGRAVGGGGGSARGGAEHWMQTVPYGQPACATLLSSLTALL